MRNKGKSGNWEVRIEQDLKALMIMCNESDQKFFGIPNKRRKTEDYTRLIIIAWALNLRGAAVVLLGEAERKKRDKEVFDCLKAVENDYNVILKWVGDFICSIQDPDYRQVATEIWKEKKARINKREFNISQFI